MGSNEKLDQNMNPGLSLIIALAFPAAVFGAPEQRAPVSETALVLETLDHVTLSEPAGGCSGGTPTPAA